MSQNTTNVVVGANVSSSIITLYFITGEFATIAITSANKEYIVKEFLPELSSNGSAIFTVPEPEQSAFNPYAEYEAKSGIAKFFTIAKAKLSSFLWLNDVEPKEEIDVPTGVVGTVDVDAILTQYGTSATNKAFDASKFTTPVNLNIHSANALAKKECDEVLVAKVG